MDEDKPDALVSERSEEISASFVSDANQNGPAKATTLLENGHDQQLTQEGERLPNIVQPVKTRMISERRRQANRANAKKSTGPRTPQGKACARRNAVKHGLRSKTLLFRGDHTAVDPELQAVRENLQNRYGQGDVLTDPLVEAVIIELSHQRRVTELEDSFFQNNFDDSSHPVSLGILQRYRTSIESC